MAEGQIFGEIIAVKESRVADDKLFDEYASVAEQTSKLSDRRQTVSDIFVGVNSLFLAAAGFMAISNKLDSWWAVGIVAAIAFITVVINSIWLRLIRRYRVLINLRIHYLEGLEQALQEAGVFGTIQMISEDDKQVHPVKRGIYNIEQKTQLYYKGPKMGFYRLELGLVWSFIGSYIALAVATAVFTYLVTNNIVSIPNLVIPSFGG